MSIHCSVCVNTNTVKGSLRPLADDEIHLVHHGHWNYICCHLHAPLVREHGISQAVNLLKHAARNNPTERAT